MRRPRSVTERGLSHSPERIYLLRTYSDEILAIRVVVTGEAVVVPFERGRVRVFVPHPRMVVPSRTGAPSTKDELRDLPGSPRKLPAPLR